MDTATTPFHAGELEAQIQAGGSRARGAGIRSAMPDQHRDFFAMLPFVLVGGLDKTGWPVATVLTGLPGFITSPDPTSLSIASTISPDDPAYIGLAAGRPIGLLGIDLATRRRNRANGHVLRAAYAGLTVSITQSFGNCPQYIQRRDVTWAATRVPEAPQALTHIDAAARSLMAAADTFFVASSAGEPLLNGGVDVSHRGGRPGFLRIEGDVLTIPDFKGNRYFNTLGNFLREPRAALLFVDFEAGDLLHLQGRAHVLWDSAAASRLVAGAERLWTFEVTTAWRRKGSVPLRWRFGDYAPTTEATGTWAV